MIIKSLKNIDNIDKKFQIDLKVNDYINLINLSTGLYRPLRGFCNSTEVRNIVNFKRINKKKNWTIPIILNFKSKIKIDFKKFYKLRYNNKVIGLIKPNDIFNLNKNKFCKKVFSTSSKKHPYVKFLYSLNNSFVGGKVYLLKEFLPKDKYLAFNQHRNKGNNIFFKKSTVFSTRNICHLGHQFIHEYIIKKNKKLTIAIIENDKNKFDPRMIIESYNILKKKLSLYKSIKITKITLPSFYAGPNEAYLQATCFKNLGFKAFIVGRDHAGFKNFFKKYESQNVFDKLKDLKIKIFKTKEPFLCSKCKKIGFELSNFCNCKNSKYHLSINGKNIKKMLLKKKFKTSEKFLNLHILKYLKKNVKKITN